MRQRTWKSIKGREPGEGSDEEALGGGTAASESASRSPTGDDATPRTAAPDANAKTNADAAGDAKADAKADASVDADDASKDGEAGNGRGGASRTRAGAHRSAGATPPNSWRYRTNPSVFAPHAGNPPDTSALNKQIVQAVSFANAETASYAASQIAIDADMVISQSAALASQSALSYFDGVSKLALASQAVLIKEMTQSLAKGAAGAPDALVQGLGVLATDIMVAAAAAVAAATGAMEGEAAGFAMDKIDQSISKYVELLDRSQGAGGG